MNSRPLPLFLSPSRHAKAVRAARARQKELRKKVAIAVRGPSKGFVNECRQWSVEIGLSLAGGFFLAWSALGGLVAASWTHGVKGVLLPATGACGLAFLLISLALVAMALNERRWTFEKAWARLSNDPNNLWVKADFDRCEKVALAGLEALEIERAIAKGRSPKAAPASAQKVSEVRINAGKRAARRL